jgi:hypothetical protein
VCAHLQLAASVSRDVLLVHSLGRGELIFGVLAPRAPHACQSATSSGAAANATGPVADTTVADIDGGRADTGASEISKADSRMNFGIEAGGDESGCRVSNCTAAMGLRRSALGEEGEIGLLDFELVSLAPMGLVIAYLAVCVI